MIVAEKKTIEIKTKRHLSMVARMYGVAQALSALKDRKDTELLPGYGLAMAIVEREVAEMRAAVMQLNLTALSDAGINIASVKDASLGGNPTNPSIVVTFHDLVSGGNSHDRI